MLSAHLTSLSKPRRRAERTRAPSLARVAACTALLLAPLSVHAAEDLNLVPDFALKLPISFAVLLLLIYPVNRLLLRPLTDVLQRRAELTRGASERAARGGDASRELREQIEARLASARLDAQNARAAALAKAEAAERDILTRARDEAAGVIERVRAEIAEDASRTRDALPALAQDLARDAAARLLGRAL